jgi:hypothetical protein
MLGSSPVGRQFRALMDGGDLRTQDIADLVAFNFLDDVPLKQALLADADVLRRVRRTIDALEAARPILQAASLQASASSDASLN